MSVFTEKYNAARAMSQEYKRAKRAWWIEKGSRVKKNEAIIVTHTDVAKLANAIYSRKYEILNLRGYMSQLAAGEPGDIECQTCHNHYLEGWMGGQCPYCKAKEAAEAFVGEILRNERG